MIGPSFKIEKSRFEPAKAERVSVEKTSTNINSFIDNAQHSLTLSRSLEGATTRGCN